MDENRKAALEADKAEYNRIAAHAGDHIKKERDQHAEAVDWVLEAEALTNPGPHGGQRKEAAVPPLSEG